MTIISISRGTFGGGKAVAESLAEKLNYLCVSREDIIQDAASAFHIKKSSLRSVILTAPKPLSLGAVNHIANIKFLQAALLEKAKAHDLVYHGYGGHLLLGGVPNLLKVRVIAGMEYRISIVMEKKNFNRKKAINHIMGIDHQRAHWSKTVWGIDWNDSSQFDLVLNLDHIKITSAVNLIIQTAALPEFICDADTISIFEDEHIVAKIWVALIMNRPTRSVRILIDCKKGCVTLSGDVGSIKLKDTIINIAKEVPGVSQVINHLSIGAGWQW
ncbi:MAG: BON domain-containing protein [Desulfobacteraceae bacterium]|nr:BON domain-containing protein [Desulfobacteraceae bacterium]